MDELVTVINTILAIIPPQHRPLALVIMAAGAALWSLGAGWAGVRWVVAKTVPAAHEPGWFQAFDVFMQIITASSSRVSTRPPPKPKDKP